MLNHCDFTEQQTVTTEEGRLRPDLTVHLPGDATIVVDAKAPLTAFLEAAEATTEEAATTALVQHAAQVRAHLTTLGRKSYWDQFERTPEFVILFLPGEHFFSAALQHDPGLIEHGVSERVLLATPTTLITLLKAVAHGWRQEALAVNAQEISDLGRELHERIATMAGHVEEMGSRLGKTIESYNAFVGSLESRVLPSARRFRDLHAAKAGTEIEPVEPVDLTPRLAQAAELRTPSVPAPPIAPAADEP
jgi:DNA recombination protein RmuC